MDSHIPKEAVDSKEAPSSGNWEQVSRVEYGSKHQSLPKESDLGENMNAEKGQNDGIDEARRGVLDVFSSQSASEQGEMKRETVSFAGVSIPKEYLGEDLVIQDKVERRVSGGLFGGFMRRINERKDEKNLSRLLDIYEDLDDDELKELLTPQVAYELVAKFKEYRSVSWKEAKIIESLPIESQEEIFKSRQKNIDYYASSFFVGRIRSCSFLMKTFACGVDTIAKQGDKRKTFRHVISILAKSYEETLGKISNSERSAALEKAYEDMAYIIDEVEKTNPKADKDTLEELRLVAAKNFLSREYFYGHFGEIIDSEYVSGDSFSFRRLCDIYEKFGAKNEDERGKLEVIPEKMRLFYEQNQKVMRKYEGHLNNLTCADVDRINERFEKYSSLISDRDLLMSALISNDERCLRVLELLAGGEKDQALINSAEIYIKKAVGFSDVSNFLIDESPINNLDDLRDWDALLEKQTREQFKKHIDEEDFETARDILSLYLYGVTIVNLAFDLVSLGVVDVPIDRETDSIYQVSNSERRLRKMRANMEVLEKMLQSGEISDNEKNLILDAVELISCSQKTIIKESEGFIKGKDTENTEPLGDIISRLIKEKTRKASINFNKYMAETINNGTEFVFNVSYVGKEIPVLMMVGNDYMMLIHHLGAYSRIENSAPEQWNDDAHREVIGDDEVRIGYISTCPIARGCMLMAATEEEIMDSNEIYYGFIETGENGLLYMSEYDLNTRDYRDTRDGKEKTITPLVTVIEEDPLKLIKRIKEAERRTQHLPHGEVVLDRYAGDINQYGGRLQPNYLVVFKDDLSAISDNVKKHAAYFGVPIIMVDYEKYS